MNQHGTGSRTMERILKNLSEKKASTTKDLVKRLNISDRNLRRALDDMTNLGIVKKEILSPPIGLEKSGTKPVSVGWRKYPPRP